MFTGIVEEKGTVTSVLLGSGGGVLQIKAAVVLEGTRIGDSICVNGVCLTVTKLMADSFAVDVMAETLRMSNLGALKRGSSVNLERAMAANGRFGGHIVSGHIDGTGTVKSLKREGNALWMEIAADSSIMNLVVHKGSIAIDGTSLTVARVLDESFCVSLIPHTLEETILLDKCPGDEVNLENDVIGKYVQKLLHSGTENAGKNTGAFGKNIESREQRDARFLDFLED